MARAVFTVLVSPEFRKVEVIVGRALLAYVAVKLGINLEHVAR